jgi:hypothetical protein
MNTEYVGAMFALDELGLWHGVHNPSTRWNGWACPLFTLETCREIAEVINALPDNEERIVVTDSQVFSVFIGNGEEETGEYEPVTIDGVNFFALGAMGWVWDVEEKRCASCLIMGELNDNELCFACVPDDGEYSEPCDECGAVMTWHGDTWTHENTATAGDCYTAHRWGVK